MRVAVLSLIYVLFGIYGWLSVVNVGIAMIKLLPHSTFTRQGQRLFAPAWEVTQLFLLCGVTGLLLCFHHGSGGYMRPVLPLLVLAAALLVARIVLVLILFETKARSGLTNRNAVFLLVTLLLPLVLGAAGIRLLGVGNFWRSFDGWTLMVSLLLGLLAGGLSFVYFVVGRTPHDRLHQVSRFANIVLAGLIGIGVQLAIRRSIPGLHTLAYEYFVVLGALAALWQLGLWFSARERYMWWYVSLLSFLTPVLWGLGARPYIAYPRVSSVDAYSVVNHGVWSVVLLSAALVALAAGTVAIANWLLRVRQHGGH